MDNEFLSETVDDGNAICDELFEDFSRESDRGLILVSTSYFYETLKIFLD